MSDAFFCDGCGEAWAEAYRFVTVEFDTDAIVYGAEFTIDDIGSGAFEVANEVSQNDGLGGDFCPECGQETLDELIERFAEGDDVA